MRLAGRLISQTFNMNKRILLSQLLCGILLLHSCQKYDINKQGIPKFVTRDFIELQKIKMISKFRSGTGHDYSDKFEDCRSMKHYFQTDTPLWSSTNVFSPVSGKISSMKSEQNGDGIQLQLVPDEYPAFTIILFHIKVLKSVKNKGVIFSGQELGTSSSTDIAVRVRTPQGIKLISYFDVMADSLFATYQLRGVYNKQELIIPKETRDASPIKCNGDEQFPNQYSRMAEDWFILK